MVLLQCPQCLLSPLRDQDCPVLTVMLTGQGIKLTFGTTYLQNGVINKIDLLVYILTVLNNATLENGYHYLKKVQVGKYQEKAKSEKDSHSKSRGGKKLNKQSGTYTMKTYRKPNKQLFPQ